MRDEAYRRQDNLASDIDELVDRVNPKNAVTRWKNELVGSMKGFSAAGDEKTPVTLPVAIAGGVIGVVLIGAGVTAAIVLSGGDGKAPEAAQKKAGTAATKKTAAARRDVAGAKKAVTKKAARTTGKAKATTAATVAPVRTKADRAARKTRAAAKHGAKQARRARR
ncbi:hypothetical protein ACFQRD_13285 [Brachybacterium sp. GCM10030268]